MDNYIPAFVGLAGVVIGALSGALTQYIIQRQETRRALQRECLRQGFAQWQQFFDSIKDIANKRGPLLPPETFVLSIFLLAPLLEQAHRLSDKRLSAELQALLRKVDIICHEYEIHGKQRHTGSSL